MEAACQKCYSIWTFPNLLLKYPRAKLCMTYTEMLQYVQHMNREQLTVKNILTNNFYIHKEIFVKIQQLHAVRRPKRENNVQ
jgi:sensor domain CHASE-containing protein